MHFMDEVHPSTYDGVNLSPKTCCGHSCQRYRTPFQDRAPPFKSDEENYHHFPLPPNCSRFYAKIIPCEMVNQCCRCNTSCCASIAPQALGRSNANYHLYSYEHPTPCKMNHCDCYYDW
ncbi:hypothetical protein WA026_014907 [Henosepilachna vigintioctopunctata]|uniref:Uncharacterized protein n=1 Tax=Henosepilachna vigintioctopunctata TaxID=420089 RepID=A0AAW1URF8_9CUCU